MKRFAAALVVGVLSLAPLTAMAEDTALILVSDDYRNLPDTNGTEPARELGQMLAASGFRVVTSIDEDTADASRAVRDFRDLSEDADRVLVMVVGHVVSTARESWLLTRYAQSPTDITVGAQAVPLGVVLDIAAAHPGAALVMVSSPDNGPEGAGLAQGLTLAAPQGVTVATGGVSDLVRFAREGALVPGGNLEAAAGRVALSGFVSQAVPFLPAYGQPPAQTPTPDREAAFWDAVTSMASVAAYRSYLEDYPNGRFAAQAQAAIRELQTSAETRAEAGEAALGLDREARREVQRNLSLLGYDPRGIDGIFGPGSRAAIEAWQRDGNYEPTGYLDAPQLGALADAASVRAAELEREAAARKAEEEKRDTAYWRETGRGADEAGLRAYLGRYPDGLFAEVAESRLAEIEADKRAAAKAEERTFWDSVRAEDKADSYREYLRRYPDGTFAKEANARLGELTKDAGNAAAKAEEDRVAGNAVTRLLVENRLQAGGYDPGRIDGTFNDRTRRAIRQFQRDAGLDVTGYVTQATMVRLLTVR